MANVKSYVGAKGKIRLITDLLTRPEGCTRIVGLAGPDCVECVQRYVDKGFRHITVHENVLEVYLKQDETLAKVFPDVNINLGDILDSPVMGNVFYDFDFCKFIESIDATRLANFKDCAYAMTFSLRSGRGNAGKNREWVENRFFEIMGETIEARWMTDYVTLGGKNCQWEIVTNKGTYLTTSYNDSGTPMLMIVKTSVNTNNEEPEI